MLKIGDKVKILRKDIFHLKYVKNPVGTVTEIDGSYIMVRPRYKRWVIELYQNEVEVQ